jgi:hypothetical protein
MGETRSYTAAHRHIRARRVGKESPRNRLSIVPCHEGRLPVRSRHFATLPNPKLHPTQPYSRTCAQRNTSLAIACGLAALTTAQNTCSMSLQTPTDTFTWTFNGINYSSGSPNDVTVDCTVKYNEYLDWSKPPLHLTEVKCSFAC